MTETGRSGQQSVQLACPLKGEQVVTAPYVLLTDPDLRYRSAARLLRHGGTHIRLAIHADFLVNRALAVQQLLGTNAVRAPVAAIYDDGVHFALTVGKLSPRQPLMPPDRRAAVKPASLSW